MTMSITEWADVIEKVTKLIDCKIKTQIISKKLGIPVDEFSDEWIVETANKLLMPPELIVNEITLRRKHLEKQEIDNL